MICSIRYIFIAILIFIQFIVVATEASSESNSYTGFRRPIVTITFDDGWLSQYQDALPILERYKIFATFYILTGSLGQPEYMTPDQVLAIYNAGHEIGAHTVTHPDLNTVSLFQVEQELKNSKQFLENLIKKPVPNFAAPYGSSSSKVLKLIEKYFKTNRSVTSALNTKNTLDLYRIKALPIVPTTPLVDIDDLLDDTAKRSAWLVLVYHRIDTLVTPLSITPSEFESRMKDIQRRNLTILTLQQALDEILPQIASIGSN